MGSYNKVLSALLLSSITTFPVLGQSQIYDCHGTWTNQPCSGATPKFAEFSAAPGHGYDEQREKQAILHQLIEMRYQVKNKFTTDIDITSVESFCQLRQTKLSECQERVDVERDRIDSKIIELQKLKLQEEELALRNRELAERANNNTAVIIQNYGTLWPTVTGTVTIPAININQPLRRPLTQITRVPAPSRGEVPNDARVPIR